MMGFHAKSQRTIRTIMKVTAVQNTRPGDTFRRSIDVPVKNTML
jgi:hypothetical protein